MKHTLPCVAAEVRPGRRCSWHLKWGGSGGLPNMVTFAGSLEGDKGEGAIWNLGEAVRAEGTARAKALRQELSWPM